MVGQLVRYVCHELNVTSSHIMYFELCWLTILFQHQVTSMVGTFYSAKAFNQPLNNWNVAAVTTMNGIFQYASAFNQNLCQWGDHYNSDKDYRYIFDQTACPDEARPTSANGPWCQAC